MVLHTEATGDAGTNVASAMAGIQSGSADAGTSCVASQIATNHAELNPHSLSVYSDSFSLISSCKLQHGILSWAPLKGTRCPRLLFQQIADCLHSVERTWQLSVVLCGHLEQDKNFGTVAQKIQESLRQAPGFYGSRWQVDDVVP